MHITAESDIDKKIVRYTQVEPNGNRIDGIEWSRDENNGYFQGGHVIRVLVGAVGVTLTDLGGGNVWWAVAD